jgi:ERCC4-type nuclease
MKRQKPKPAAFMSYVQSDDKYGRLTEFRERLGDEVRVQIGEEFLIFQDRKDILWGQNWKKRIEESLDEVTFLIPIITPSFFNSPACSDELQRFLEREKELGRNDLVLPIYYVDCPLLNDEEKRAGDKLAQAIADHQYADWRDLRFEPFTSPQVGRTLERLAIQIRDALERVQAESSDKDRGGSSREDLDREDLEGGDSGQASLVVYIDHKEIRSDVSQIIEDAGIEVVMRTLEIGNYLLSDRVCVERKTTSDFISSLISGRRELFGQISDLARTFDKPVLIIEGGDLYGHRQIHPNAVRGALIAIALDFGVSILLSKDAEDTALMIAAIARREQQDHGREVVMHGARSAMMLPRQQECVVSAIPGIGPVVVKNLLKHFGTVAAVMSASREELTTVELVGPKTADRIREVVGGEYKE